MCISPLTSIVMDQKAIFTPRSIVAELVGESQEDQSAVNNVLQGKVQLVSCFETGHIGPCFSLPLTNSTWSLWLWTKPIVSKHDMFD